MKKCFGYAKKIMTALVAVFFLSFFSAAEAVSVKGLPDWALESAFRSIQAVRDEIPKGLSAEEKNNMLLLVAQQIFRGYDVNIQNKDEILLMSFTPNGDSRKWSVEIVPPQLREPADAWFLEDMKGFDNDASLLLKNFPIEALSWADVALRERLRELLKSRISGWNFSLLVRIEGDKKILQLSFVPEPPFVLSVAASVRSNALPVMFQTDLSAKLVADISPIIGIPVAWAVQHEKQITALAIGKLEERNAVSNIKASVSASFTPDQISRLDARTDSERFFFSLKLAAYAGSRGRVPELWLTAGWRTNGFTKLPLDIYSESFLALDAFKFHTRVGTRLEVAANFMIGAEYATPNDNIWARFWWDNPSIAPYFWWRWNNEFGHNFALGYRLREDLAIELHYDERDRDNFSIRGIFQF